MRFFGAGIVGAAIFAQSLFGTEAGTSETLNPARFEVAVQSGYLLGVFGNPDSYEIAPQFISGRIRWGVNDSPEGILGWTRGYNQFCLTLMAEPIIRWGENHYFGVNFGGRYKFVRPY